MIYVTTMLILAFFCIVAGWDASWGQVSRDRRPLVLGQYETLFGIVTIVAVLGVLATTIVFWVREGFMNGLMHLGLFVVCFFGGAVIVNFLLRIYFALFSR